MIRCWQDSLQLILILIIHLLTLQYIALIIGHQEYSTVRSSDRLVKSNHKEGIVGNFKIMDVCNIGIFFPPYLITVCICFNEQSISLYYTTGFHLLTK